MQTAAAQTELPVFRLKVAQYHAMRDAGILGDEDRVELLDGLLVPKMTKRPPHRLATGLVREALESAIPTGYYVDSQEPICTPDSEPEPDVAIVRGQRRDYAGEHPTAGDVALLVEVADDSLERDRGLKLRLYARAGIPTYWIVNLRDRAIEVYSSPSQDSFASRAEYSPGMELPLVIDGREIARLSVATLLP